MNILDRYHLNGNRSIAESSHFHIGQTHVWYRRGHKNEVLEGHGQGLLEDIDIMILILNTDLIQIKYSYWQMTNTSKSMVLKNNYQWTWENDINNDCLCQKREPICAILSKESEKIVVSDHLCNVKLKPSSVQCQSMTCSGHAPAAPRWQLGSWRTCEGRCRPQEAIQRRSLLCVRTLKDNRTHAIPTSICLRLLPSIPITVRECPLNVSLSIPECTSLKTYSRWDTSEWIGVRHKGKSDYFGE